MIMYSVIIGLYIHLKFAKAHSDADRNFFLFLMFKSQTYPSV